MKNPYYGFEIEVSGNTSLKSLEGVYYKYNIGQYNKFKNIMIFISGFIAIVCIVLMFFTKGVLQTLFATILGGTFSSIIWWISVYTMDNMNHRIQMVDSEITNIDKMLYDLENIRFYSVDGLKVIEYSKDDIGYRIVNLLRVIGALRCSNNIDSKDIRFKWFDETEMNIDEFEIKLEGYIGEPNKILFTKERLEDFANYNERHLEGQLKELKYILLKRKQYILCGHAPVPQSEVQKRLNKAKEFDKIFNHRKDR